MICKKNVFLSQQFVFVLVNRVDQNKIRHYAIFHLGLHCLSKYCEFGNFRENFIFANRVKRHICHGKNLRL